MKTMQLIRRADGHGGPIFDLSTTSARDYWHLWDGLVMKIDFEIWMPSFDPPMGEDETPDEWLAR